MRPTAADRTVRRPGNLGEHLNRLILGSTSGLALIILALVVAETLGVLTLPSKAGWPEAVLLITATVATLAALSRHLSLQNVLLGAGIIAIIGGLAHLLTALTGLPLGPLYFPAERGPRLFDCLSWALPLVWVLVVLNSRSVARLMLRPWRKIRAYGYWLIGLTATLSVLLDAAMEPFASHTHQYWIWLPTRLPVSWYEVPVTNFGGWLLVTTMIMAFAAPALMNKRQRPQKFPADFHPLIMWLLAVGWFTLDAFVNQLWLAGGYGVALGLFVTVFAVRGARW